MKALMVVNPKSGAVQRIGAEALMDLAVRLVKTPEISLEAEVGDVDALLAAVRNDKVDAVICAGGDGTQAAIAGALLDTETALLPLPCGTINALCRDLGISLDVEEVLTTALSGPTIRIDIGRINDRVFLNNVAFGAYAALAEARESFREAKTLDDLSFSLVGAADAITHADAIRFHVSIDGNTEAIDTNTIVVSNNAISSAENLIPHRGRIDEGKLHVYLADAHNAGDFAALLVDFLRGGAKTSERIEVRTGKKCRVSSPEETFSYTVDGDPVETGGPVDIEIAPAALKVFAPGVEK